MAHLATPGNRVEPLISASVEPKAEGLGTTGFMLYLGSFDTQPLVSVDWHKCQRIGGQNTGNMTCIKLERVDMGRMPQNERAACDADIETPQYRWFPPWIALCMKSSHFSTIFGEAQRWSTRRATHVHSSVAWWQVGRFSNKWSNGQYHLTTQLHQYRLNRESITT